MGKYYVDYVILKRVINENYEECRIFYELILR